MNRNEASRLVELMGADWQERPVPPDHHNADKRTELVRKDGLSLSLTFGGGWRTEHRLSIHASFESKQGLSRSLRDYARTTTARRSQRKSRWPSISRSNASRRRSNAAC